MNQNSNNSWWDLHVKKARGEALSENQQRAYEAVLAEQDHEECLTLNISQLRELRTKVEAMAKENAQVRVRLATLENEIQQLEQSLGKQTRELLGMRE